MNLKNNDAIILTKFYGRALARMLFQKEKENE